MLIVSEAFLDHTFLKRKEFKFCQVGDDQQIVLALSEQVLNFRSFRIDVRHPLFLTLIA
jgi:hypothetical protein